MGLSHSALSKRVAKGALTRRYPGVYSYGRGELSTEAQWMAAVLACGDGAALAHVSTIGLCGCSRWRPGAPHVLVPRRHRPVDGIVIHHARGGFGVVLRYGVPTTTMARALLDFSADATPHQVAYVINEAAYRRLFSLEATRRGIMSGHPGAPVLKRALELYQQGSAGTKSALEDRFLALVAAFPEPLVNVEHLGYEVDFRWEDERVIVEVDGNHTRPKDRRGDAARDRVLREAGYAVLRFTEAQLPAARSRLAEAMRGRSATARRPGRRA